MTDAEQDLPPRSLPPSPERAKLVHNEQVKLTATTINGVALAFLVGGGVTTMIGLGTVPGTTGQALRATAWIFTGIILHSVARLFLRTLR